MQMQTARAGEDRVFGIAPGDLIGGRYEVVRMLGVGGTGAVFEARHRLIGRAVAVKILLPELSTNPNVPQRFLQEARTAYEVRHRNIVEVLDFGDDNGRLFMVMEFLRGESLAQRINRDAPMSPAQIIPLVDPVLSALGAAHDRAVVHRDVKPQNVFLAEDDGGEITPKLIDFGIAKRLVDQDMNLTGTGMILGTPAYMSPEQAQGEKDITGAADQYAVGAMLYQAFCGHVPHQADTYPAMLIALVTQTPKPLGEHRPDLDPGLCAVVTRMLSRDPRDRFQGILAARDALRDYKSFAASSPFLSTPPVRYGRTRPDGTPSPNSTDPPDGSLRPAAAPFAVTPGTPLPAYLPAQVPARVPPVVAVSHTLSTQRPAMPPAEPAGPSRAHWIALAFTGALAMMATTVWLALSHGPVSGPTPVARAAAPNVDSVTFRIDVEPSNAAITLDGTLLGNGHTEVIRPRDGRRYQLHISVPGYAAVSDVLVASSDARVSRVLARLDGPPEPPRPQPLHPVANGRAPTPPAVPTPAPQDPPRRPDGRHFTIDRRNPF